MQLPLALAIGLLLLAALGLTDETQAAPTEEQQQVGQEQGVEVAANSEPDMPDVCTRCDQLVEEAQRLVDDYEAMLKRHKERIRSSKKKSAARGGRGASNNNNNNNSSSTVRSRTLQGQQIVVSSLRVARSPNLAGAVEQRDQVRELESKLASKSLLTDKLKREAERKNELTCRSLLALRECLLPLSQECIGVLLYHTYELFADQYRLKFLCPHPSMPGVKLLPGIAFKRSDQEDDERRMGLPRRISDEMEVRKRLQDILPSRQFPAWNPSPAPAPAPALALAAATTSPVAPPTVAGNAGPAAIGRPLGVMLRPTLAGEQQQARAPHQSFTRDLGPFTARSGPLAGVSVAQPIRAADERALNMSDVGKLLLVPSCFAILVLLAALLGLRYTRPELVSARSFGGGGPQFVCSPRRQFDGQAGSC